jgi:Ca-activated chloride channel homolog
VALRYPNLSVVKHALSGATAWRRHIPPAILLAAISAMILAGARPVMEVMVPVARKTIVLAMDVSGSMQATDVSPTRLIASQLAAKEFVSKLPASVRAAVVAYAGSAHLVQAPTSNRGDVIAAIDALQLQRATAIGNGIIVSLGTIFPGEGIDVSSFSANQGSHDAIKGESAPWTRRNASPGSYGAAAVVLLSDGQNTTGINPIDAANFAARLGVRIFTVGFGTREGASIRLGGWSMRVNLDEETLRQVAKLSTGEYYRAENRVELEKVYENLTYQLIMEKGEQEVSSWFANLAAMLTLLAAALSIAWFGRII